MHHLILAAINPDNTPSGYQWTYLFPMLLFIVIAAILYMLFSRPHRRVPARFVSLGARSAGPANGAPVAAGTGPEASAGEAASGEAAGAAEQSGEDTKE